MQQVFFVWHGKLPKTTNGVSPVNWKCQAQWDYAQSDMHSQLITMMLSHQSKLPWGIIQTSSSPVGSFWCNYSQAVQNNPRLHQLRIQEKIQWKLELIWMIPHGKFDWWVNWNWPIYLNDMPGSNNECHHVHEQTLTPLDSVLHI